MVDQGVDPDAIDCTQVQKAMEEHALRLLQQQEGEGEGSAGAGVSDSGLVTEPVENIN